MTSYNSKQRMRCKYPSRSDSSNALSASLAYRTSLPFIVGTDLSSLRKVLDFCKRGFNGQFFL